ncbi:hypothetical protein BT93_L4616 [Corymbia citriodora subsp. variegata]|uniref:Uncharacterized protein n=1 Tax=Corymbia citriodora subsp. variegata TaxID=360336 RepID=A0A8T0CXN1_CORYI|nr:hypothetical protein BT93_L4616 [Corymbia citriodora subsp. variegata]
MSGPQCCENPPILNPSCGAGHVEQLCGLNTYIVGSQDSKLAILLLSDIFGYEAPNFRYAPLTIVDQLNSWICTSLEKCG